MDKVMTKDILNAYNLPNAPFLSFTTADDKEAFAWEQVTSTLGEDLFVKPANLGSSVGISHITRERTYKKAVDLAFAYDRKIRARGGLP